MFLVRQLLAVWPLIQKGFWIFPKIMIKGLRDNLGGSLKDPLLYLGIISFFLFSFVSLGAPAFLSSLPGSTSSSLLSPIPPSRHFGQLSNNKLFLNQKKAQKFDFSLFSIVQGNAMLGVSTPVNISPQVLGALAEGSSGSLPETRNEILEYIVQSGDTLSGLAEKFDISLNTIIWANDLSKDSNLQIGQKLVILPVSGLIHHVKKGETISGITALYKAETDEIILLNDLSGDGDIVVGDILIVPNGQKPSLSSYIPAPTQVPLASSYFICPITSPCGISQGLHWYNAIDFTNGQCGEPIYAAAQGTVLKVKYGWNGGAGNYISLLHPNGIVTMYGHLASMLVSPGQEVSQGQMIAKMGGKPGTPGAGTSTGCHVHFGVRGARNPFSR